MKDYNNFMNKNNNILKKCMNSLLMKKNMQDKKNIMKLKKWKKLNKILLENYNKAKHSKNKHSLN